MFLFAGLGNVGKAYTLNRHNLGFLVIDSIIEKYKLEKKSNKFDSAIFRGKISNQSVLAVKPTTMMNLSGVSISKIKRFYKVPSGKIYIFHDDLDLILGRIKIKRGGSSGGHNGIKSIDATIGYDYNRIRFGIGKPELDTNVNKHVLSDFNKEELSLVMKKVALIVNDLTLLLEFNFESFVKNISGLKN